MDAPMTGSAGRTLTQVAPTGRVEVNGVAYQAETSLFCADPQRPPIPADVSVVVSGWRGDNEHGVVLLVQEAGPIPTPEARIAALERQLRDVMQTVGRGRSAPRVTEAGGAGWLLLTFGQVVSVLGCLAAPVYALTALSQTAAVRERARDVPNPSLWIIVGALVVLLYSAAMFVVFTRCKQVPAD